jgi:hypothetical protein
MVPAPGGGPQTPAPTGDEPPPDRIGRFLLGSSLALLALLTVGGLGWYLLSPGPVPATTAPVTARSPREPGDTKLAPTTNTIALRPPVTSPDPAEPKPAPPATTARKGPGKEEAGIDPALVGTWEATITTKDGTWKVTFHLSATGSYRSATEGPGNLPDESGTFRASTGKWSVVANKGPIPGRTDEGTYELANGDTLILTGQAGPVTWKRASTAAAPPANPPGGGDKPEARSGEKALGLKSTELSLGRTDNLTPSLPVVSPDQRHQMYVARGIDKARVVLDGISGKEGYDAITSRLLFSPDSKRTAFTALRGGKSVAVVDGAEGPEADEATELQFSADGKRVGYILAWNQPGSATKVYRAVTDGTMGQPYYQISELAFSPVSKHVAYRALRGTPLNPQIDCVVVLDGKEWKNYSRIPPGTLRFSPASNLPAFIAWRGRAPLVVLDGVEGPAADQLHFSPDGKRVALSFHSNNKSGILVDGKEWKLYDGTLANITFSPDGRHFAYTVIAISSPKFMVVVDGKEGPVYEAVRDFQFGADGSRFAYLGRKGFTEVCVTDAGEEKPSLLISDLTISPDGKHVAYKALGTGGSVVVRDGKEQKPYMQILDGSLRFSPDGRRLAYWVMGAGGLAVVANGVEGKGYGYNGFVPGLGFSPDGRHLAYVAVRGDGTGVVVVDGVEGPKFDRALEAPVVFDAPNRFHVLAVRGLNLIRLEVEISDPGR